MTVTLTFADLMAARRSLGDKPAEPRDLFSALAEEEKSVISQLALILESLADVEFLKKFSRRDFEAVYGTAAQILNLIGVDRRKLKLASVAAELRLIKARFEFLHGNFVEALWALGEIRTNAPDPKFLQAVDHIAGELFLRLGEAQVALVRLESAASGPLPRVSLAANKSLLKTRIFLGEKPSEVHQDPALQILVGEELRTALICDRHAAPEMRLRNKLWTYAVENRQVIASIIRVDSLVKAIGGPVKSEFKVLVPALRALESAYDNGIPLNLRLEQLREAFLARKHLLEVEEELLLLAGIYRFGQRSPVP